MLGSSAFIYPQFLSKLPCVSVSCRGTSNIWWVVGRLLPILWIEVLFLFFFLSPQVLFIYLFYFTILYWFCHTLTWIHHGCTMCSPSWTPLPPPFLSHPSGSSQCTSPEHPVSCIKPGLVIRFTYDNLHVSTPFSHIIPPSPSPTESKRLFYTSVSLLLSHIQGHRYHLCKFHIYALVCCICVFLSGLLHSV